jgi:predicted DsbA family dithiol-disulfide isomerase
MARVTVTEFTDPYGTWCWWAEPVVRRLQEVYRDQFRLEYVMGGLAEDFEDFHDPANADDWTEGVAPHWVTASDRHGMPVDVSVWQEDPPRSSYPANVAYETAALQDRTLAHTYLRRLREAGMGRGRNLASEAVLVDFAGEVGLDVEQFRREFDGERARRAFEEDLRRKHEHGVTALPTFLVEVDDQKELLRGFRPFVSFEKLLTARADDLREHDPRPIPELVGHYGCLATKEVAEIHQLSPEDAESKLRALAEEGVVEAVEAGTGYFWRPA